MIGKLSALVAAATAGDINVLVERVLAQLPPDALFVGPKHIAPLLGLSAHGFAEHCRTCGATRAWHGSYRLCLDDPVHRRALACVVRLVRWSGRKLPLHLREETPPRSYLRCALIRPAPTILPDSLPLF